MSIQDKLKSFMQNKINQQKQEGEAFLLANKENAGVHTLPEGIQYEILKEGTGAQPSPDATVTAHYKGSLLNGTVFDSSFARNQPFTAPLKHLIKGWQIAIPHMKEGSHWRLWIPSHLAYGDAGAGKDIPGGATLIFEVELLSIGSAK